MPKTNQQENSNITAAQSEKIRSGAPDGPRQCRRMSHDRREPLEYPGHETVAQFMATPQSMREFKSVTALAKHLNLARKTIHCWMNDVDVMRRAEWLSMRNKGTGDLIPRREWLRIMENMVRLAIGGNVAAAKFCAERAFPEDQQAKKSGLSTETLDEVAAREEERYVRMAEVTTPLWMREKKTEKMQRARRPRKIERRRNPRTSLNGSTDCSA
jgi:hypothetical protein